MKNPYLRKKIGIGIPNKQVVEVVVQESTL